MPREGTKTRVAKPIREQVKYIEIRYAPGGDENTSGVEYTRSEDTQLRLDMPREGTKTRVAKPIREQVKYIEIRYAPGGDENKSSKTYS